MNGPAADDTPSASRPDAADAPASQRTPGWREVLIVSAGVVLVVLGAAVVTGFLPESIQRVIFHAPVLIGVLLVGTVVVLLGVARRQPPVG